MTDQIAISKNGNLIELPKNFEKLSEKKQRNMIIAALQEQQMQIADLFNSEKELSDTFKLLNQRIKQSKEYGALIDMKKQIKDLAKQRQSALMERQGALKLAAKLGFDDIREDLRRIKQIEG